MRLIRYSGFSLTTARPDMVHSGISWYGEVSALSADDFFMGLYTGGVKSLGFFDEIFS